MKAKKLVTAMSAALLSTAAFSAGHYVPGVEGIQAATVPPPGIYYLGYVLNYNIDKISGVPGRSTGSVTALANRFVWITKQKFLGANYGVEAIAPLQTTSLNLGGNGFDKKGLGDIFVSPLILAWHGQNWDAVATVGEWLKNGSFSATNPASVGKGFRSTMYTLGGTFYPDSQKEWSLSVLARYETNGKQDDTRITPGDGLSIEWGIGKQIGGGKQLGLVGYHQRQTTKDRGPGASPFKPSKSAVGIQFDYPILERGMFLKFAAYKEFSADETAAEGKLFRLSIIKAF